MLKYFLIALAKRVACRVLRDEIGPELGSMRARQVELERRVDELSSELGKLPIRRKFSIWS